MCIIPPLSISSSHYVNIDKVKIGSQLSHSFQKGFRNG